MALRGQPDDGTRPLTRAECVAADLKQLILVGLGGFAGSIARYLLGGVLWHATESWRFPVATFSINVLGCFVLGLLAGAGERYLSLSAEARLLLFTGVLGGFTTFSAFGAEGLALVRRGEFGTAAGYASLSVLGGFTAVWVGMKLGALLGPVR